MHINTISFCDRIGYNIKCDILKKEILETIECKYGVKIIQKHFEKVTQASIKVLNDNPHIVCIKTNGNPYLLYFTRYNNVNQCIFIDKKIQQGYFYPRMILVKAWFGDSLFNGTLIDGEMVKDSTGSWIYIANDLLVLNDTFQIKVSLPVRLRLLIDIFKNMYLHDPWTAYCTFQVKRYFHYHEINEIRENFIPNLPYTVRGLLFKNISLRYKD